MNLKSTEKYISRNPLNYRIEGKSAGENHFSVVIPCFAEYDYLPLTLKSLATNPPELLMQTLVLLVINNPANCAELKFDENQRTLEALRSNKWNLPEELRLAFIDASSEGRALPGKGGAGAARKLGMDAALHFIKSEKALLFSLDADTLVPANYLCAADELFSASPECSGAVFRFAHQRGKTEAEDKAITDYELLMRYYVMSLKYALSPYAYYSIGSAIVCTAGAYAAAGGMREREAGEDFYFMQALRKTGTIGSIEAACIFPSARVSDRVPFGTGPMIRDIVNGESVKLYNHKIFEILRDFMLMVNNCSIEDFAVLHECKKSELSEFLAVSGFIKDWPAIYKNAPKNRARLIYAFHVWFDALKTLKFIHFMESYSDDFRRENIEDAFMKLLKNMDGPNKCAIFQNRFEFLKRLRTQGV